MNRKKLHSKNKLVNTRISYYQKVHIDKMLNECKKNGLKISNTSDFLRSLISMSQSLDFLWLLYERDYKTFKGDQKTFLIYCVNALDKIKRSRDKPTLKSNTNA